MISNGRYQVKKSFRLLMFGGIILAGVVTSSVCAQETQSGAFQFGPGTTNGAGDATTLSVPARTTVSVVVLLQRNLSGANGLPVLPDVAVAIDVVRPDGTVAISQPATVTVVNAGVPVPSIPVPGFFNSQRGCPSPWSVRVHTPNNAAPPVKVFGTITYLFERPGTVNLDMEGGTVNLNADGVATKTLAGHNLTGTPDRTLIAGTGTFRIKAKWHTDPLDVIHFNQFFQLTVALLKPDGTVVHTQAGFSQHAPSGFSPKLDFSYTVTPQDALMTGVWKLRISSGRTNPKVVDFDLERGLDPNPSLSNFNSTFRAACH